ncbi:MAG: beta-lactamase family protein [Tissierellales bacterium]|nr:beta-lactamase family protein [Tissierellales bacterium]
MKSIGYILLVMVSLPFFNCSHDTRPLEDQIRTLLNNRIHEYGVKGVSAAVVLPDGVVHRVCAGVSHDNILMTPQMLFAIGSITKNIVAVLILQLAEEGKLSLEDPIHKWLQPIPKVDSSVTIRQMLNHTSGIFMFWDNNQLWNDLITYRDSVFTPEVVLKYLQEPHFAPGTGFRYSNTNYLLLAMIATRATQSTLSEELRRRFWRPLGFRNTYLSIEEQIPQNQLAHVWGDNFENDGSNRDITFLPRTSHETITYGSSGVFTTAEELAIWCKSLFDGRVISSSSVKQMVQIGRGGYGLGIGLLAKGSLFKEKSYGHGGGNIGTTAFMAFLPDLDVSVVVMINLYDVKHARIMLNDIIDIVGEYDNE